MRKFFLAVSAVLVVASASAQETRKSGWSFTPMPDFSYSSDLGLNLGAWGDLFYYGKGDKSLYPNYVHHAGFTGAYTTKGSWHMHTFYESDHLIPGIGVKMSATYRSAGANNFYGFNGIASPFDPSLELNKDTRTAFYTNRRRFARVAALLDGRVKGNLGWIGGLVFRHVRISDYTLQNYDSGHSLYLDYIDKGLIRADEASGGTSLEFKAGLTYDSRDYDIIPSKGIYSSLYLIQNIDLRGTHYNYGQVVAHYSQFFPILPERIILAGHLALQHQLWGSIPFYNINELGTPEYRYEEFSGLGSRYSIRGYRYNRIAAAGYAWANIELRCTPFIFDIWDQHIELLAIPFVDLACITKTYRLEEQKALGAPYYQDSKMPLMPSYGLGLKLQRNRNFILSVDFAWGPNPQVNAFMVGMASSYIF